MNSSCLAIKSLLIMILLLGFSGFIRSENSIRRLLIYKDNGRSQEFESSTSQHKIDNVELNANLNGFCHRKSIPNPTSYIPSPSTQRK